ncbi:UNVERIFIED_CONTAM: hypothetical protein GTU68_041435 [Idotea baltica]|nr:hypothetical protein [Idotea baltica]
MNARSSRSHAIFSLHLEIGNKMESDNIVSAKFHLVDLAGSERAKKTGATGESLRKGQHQQGTFGTWECHLGTVWRGVQGTYSVQGL